MDKFLPGYLNLLLTGDLKNRVEQAYNHLTKCDICPHKCHVDRINGKLGVCRTGKHARISSFGPHFGEEDPLRGFDGSGTIFFSRCNLGCIYCQNHTVSQTNSGVLVEPEELATIMLELQSQGCHNINFVSPSHIVPQILSGILIAANNGLNLPLVYNTGGYDSIATLTLLNGIIDIFLPDMKYADPKIGYLLSKIQNYPQINQAAVKEMHHQVGDLQLDANGIATRGLLVRHLIMPDNLAGTDKITSYLAEEISTNTYLNIMDQYRPAYQAHTLPVLNRSIKNEEYRQAIQWALEAGLSRLDHR